MGLLASVFCPKTHNTQTLLMVLYQQMDLLYPPLLAHLINEMPIILNGLRLYSYMAHVTTQLTYHKMLLFYI